MTITPASLLSCLISSALFTALAWVIIKRDYTLKVVGKYIGIFLTIIVARMLLPVEFGFTVTFYSENIMTWLRDVRLLEISVGEYGITVNQLLLFIWIAGAVCRFFIKVWEYIHLIQMIGKCPGCFERNVGLTISRINREYGKEGEFRVLFVPGIQTPAILGILHPRILMPMEDYTEGEIYYILKHEMLHYYHHDMLVKILCEILCTVYWWNPAVFLLRKIIARVLEIRVDCLLTSGFGKDEKIRYLKCLVKSMKAGRKKDSNMMITFTVQKGSVMKQRFCCIYENHWLEKGRKGVLIAAVSCLMFLVSISFVVEADYGSDIPGTFSYPNPETSFLIEKDGSYEVYIDGEYLGDVYEITEPITELKIYKSKEDLTNEK